MVSGRVVRFHDEDGVRVIDEFTVDMAHPYRDCLCRLCHDSCITVTASEFCADCEVSAATGREPCH